MKSATIGVLKHPQGLEGAGLLKTPQGIIVPLSFHFLNPLKICKKVSVVAYD